MAIGDQVEIPANVLIRCPLRKQAFVSARKCEGCEHFAGLGELYDRPEMPFIERFVIQCAFPTVREMAQVEA